MKSFSAVSPTVNNQRGGVVIFVAVAMVVLIGCAALAIDLAHLYVARNELQNAADAGALAGARFLFVNDGTYDATSAINASGFVSVENETIPSANKLGHDTAEANKSDKVPVEVDWDAGQNTGSDVERGHWSFGLGSLARGFYPSDSTAMVSLNLVSVVALDQNTDFINAVRVRASSRAPKIVSWFARIFGRDSFQLSADAVAYVGYAGLLEPLKSDQPIGICLQAVVQDGVYDCNQGRMLNSGQDPAEHNTAGWINYSQYPCTTANAAEMRSLICNPDGANSEAVEYGEPMGAQGGVQSSTLRELIKCWISQTDTDYPNGDCIPDKVWNMTLPVIDCPGNNVSNCPTLIGVVNVNFAWLLGNVGKYVQKNPDPAIDTPIAADHPDAPVPVIACEITVDNGDGTTTKDLVPCTQFESLGGNLADDCSNVLPIVPSSMSFEDAEGNSVVWSNSSPDAQTRWANFVAPPPNGFGLRNVNDLPADFAQKTMYFFPDCKYHEPTGNTGGQWAGVLAEIPVLVE
jgi:Flp pilus assembly protein TadG